MSYVDEMLYLYSRCEFNLKFQRRCVVTPSLLSKCIWPNHLTIIGNNLFIPLTSLLGLLGHYQSLYKYHVKDIFPYFMWCLKLQNINQLIPQLLGSRKPVNSYVALPKHIFTKFTKRSLQNLKFRQRYISFYGMKQSYLDFFKKRLITPNILQMLQSFLRYLRKINCSSFC